MTLALLYWILLLLYLILGAVGSWPKGEAKFGWAHGGGLLLFLLLLVLGWAEFGAPIH